MKETRNLILEVLLESLQGCGHYVGKKNVDGDDFTDLELDLDVWKDRITELLKDDREKSMTDEADDDFLKLEESGRRIEKKLNDLRGKADELGCIRATLFVNYDPIGKKQDGVEVDSSLPTHDMMVSVLRQYTLKIAAMQDTLLTKRTLPPPNYESKYHDLMDALRSSRMEHGDCKSGKRYGGIPKACTACMAIRKLDEELAEYKGRVVRLV